MFPSSSFSTCADPQQLGRSSAFCVVIHQWLLQTIDTKAVKVAHTCRESGKSSIMESNIIWSLLHTPGNRSHDTFSNSPITLIYPTRLAHAWSISTLAKHTKASYLLCDRRKANGQTPSSGSRVVRLKLLLQTCLPPIPLGIYEQIAVAQRIPNSFLYNYLWGGERKPARVFSDFVRKVKLRLAYQTTPCTPGTFSRDTFHTTHLLHQTTFTADNFYTNQLLHLSYTFTPTSFYNRNLWHHPSCTPVLYFYTNQLLHQTPFTPTSFYTRHLLHQPAFTLDTLYTRNLFTRHLSH